METPTNEKMPEIIHPSWHTHLQPLFNDHKMILIRDNLLADGYYYPDKTLIFKVFAMPLDKIKVVILGQDPYPNGEAIGKSFAVAENIAPPPSLKIIRNEIINSKVERFSSVNIDSSKWRTLSHWSMQGVFLLNTALTVQKKNSGSHLGQWGWFTRSVLRIVSQQKPIWLLWGAKAIGFKDMVNGEILTAPHPAAETYTKGTSRATFTGCNHFNLCNQLLKQKGQTIINW